MAQLNLRSATLADVEAIRGCIASAYAEAMRDLPDLPDVTSGIDEDIKAHNVFVAEENAQVLGVIVFGTAADAITIFNLAVSPDAQGRGIARRLMDRAESEARASGLPRLRLRTHVKMASTRAMYRHLGWHERETSENTVLMEKSAD